LADGSNHGVVDTRDAMEMARNLRMDLIEVAPAANPPVCRIMDYGKFTYEREKKERAAKKSQKQIEVKGVQLRPKTTDHHLLFKIRAARRFLEQGNKVKVNLKFRGRENTHVDVGRRMIEKVLQGVADLAVIEVSPGIEGKGMLAVVAPTQATLAAAANKAVQQRIEAERQADIAAGYDEKEDESVEDDDDGGDGASAGEETHAAVDAHKPTYEEKLAERKAANREKRKEKLANEQLGLP
jgi:translation initiation factor IF-3